MSLPRFAIQQRVTTVMISFGIVFLGIISLFSIRQELFPPLTFPQVTILTEYSNAAPEEIETLITRPLEEAISSTNGLRELRSISREGKSTLFASFGWNENVDFAALSVREKIDLVKERLPKESGDPIVLKFDPLSRPIMILSITGKMSQVDLKLLTEHLLKENLEKIEGVASATISGGLDREIQVNLDQGQLQSTQVSILEVVDAIEHSNISYPAGSIKKGLYEYLIRTVGEFKSVPEIAYTVIGTDTKREMKPSADIFLERGSRGSRDTLDTLREEQGRVVADKRLVMIRDVGTVLDTYKEKTSISRYNGKENISLSIQKQGSANTVKVVQRIREELKFLQDDIKSRGINVEIIYDHSTFITQAISSVRDAAIAGAFIAALILYPFFKNWLSTIIVNIGIPISLIGTFFIFQVHGISLNTMSLAGLALGVGMMTDNSIVVVENIFRWREKGLSEKEAAIEGATEVFWPVISSTLTTIAVFLPMILFVPGVAGQLFKDLSWAVIYCLILSLLVSVTVIPMLSVYIKLPKGFGGGDASPASPNSVRSKTKTYFSKLDQRGQNLIFLGVVGFGFLTFLISIIIFRSLDTEVLPHVDQGQFLVKVNLPVGSRLEATDEVVKTIEIEAKKIPEIKNVTVTVGSSSSSKVGEVAVETLRQYQALILIDLDKKRKRSSSLVATDLKEKVAKYKIDKAEIEFVLQESEFDFAAAGGKPIVIEVKGYDLDALTKLVRRVEKLADSIPGINEILNDFGEPSPETKVEIDRKKAALFAISAMDISLTAKAALEGAVASKFKESGLEVDIRVRLEEKDRKDLSQIGEMLVYSKALETPVAIRDVAKIKQGYGPSEIRRKDQIRTITITAAIMKGYKEKEILAKLDKALHNIDMPKDYMVDLTGKAREVGEAFRRIAFATALALILNYMIMAAQFESFLHPFIIMFTVPLALIGVAVALWVTNTALSVISLLGILILGGNVVNNAIVLIDFINQSRREGMELVEACIESVFVRYRPIIMSTVTTIVGLIPLAMGIGEGAELQAPLAIGMIGGLSSATFFTLCVIPSVYVLVTRFVDGLFGESYADEPAS